MISGPTPARCQSCSEGCGKKKSQWGLEGHQQNLIEASGRVKSGGSLLSVLVEGRLVPMRLEGPTKPPHTHTLLISSRLSVKTPNLRSFRERCSHGKTRFLLFFGCCCCYTKTLGLKVNFSFFCCFRSISVKFKSQSQKWEDESKTVNGVKACLCLTPLHKFLEENTCFAPTCLNIAGSTRQRLPTK